MADEEKLQASIAMQHAVVNFEIRAKSFIYNFTIVRVELGGLLLVNGYLVLAGNTKVATLGLCAALMQHEPMPAKILADMSSQQTRECGQRVFV